MATRKRFRLDWPLLGKELIEQSARKQMYVLRVAYALLLFGAFCLFYVRRVSEGTVLALGGGYAPFQFLMATQMVAILLFLPPLMAGAVAQEKERDTLGLLFLTGLTPWELVLQKYVGRLIPMLTLLLLSLPLMAVTYSLGGVSIGMLCTSALTLFLVCLAVGAIALQCSVHQASTFQALLRCWGFCLLFVVFCVLPFPRFVVSRMVGAGSQLIYLPSAVMAGIVYLLPTWFFLHLAKQDLEARAFVRPRNPFADQFKQLDRYWKDLRKLLRAILRTRDPEAHAIAEQVVRRQVGTSEPPRSLGWFLMARMQVPTLLAISILGGLFVVLYLFATVLMESETGMFSVVVNGFWILALLTIPIQSANAVSRERMSERLGPLLTTPLTGPEILIEWLAPIRRWIQFVVRPLIGVFLVGAWLKYKTIPDGSRWGMIGLYLGISLLTVWIYPRLVQWYCLWIGLKIRNQVRAMMTALLATAAWCFVPLLLSDYFRQTGLLTAEFAGRLKFISPVTIIRTAEALGTGESNTGWLVFALVAVHLALLAIVMLAIRQTCLENADRYLGRV